MSADICVGCSHPSPDLICDWCRQAIIISAAALRVGPR